MPVMNEPMSMDMTAETKPEMIKSDMIKSDSMKLPTMPTVQSVQDLKQQHPLHQFDLTQMSKFYAACVGKLKETHPDFHANKWAERKEGKMSQKHDSPISMAFSSKQRLYEAFQTLAMETGEPMIIMPNFDYGDIVNFERFLQALKQDGVNAIGKYKLYLSNKDMRKFEVDLVVVHPKHGIMLFEVKDCDHMDNKRRLRAKSQLRNARLCFESMGRLIAEAKGWTTSESHLKVTEYIVLPNVVERPMPYVPKQTLNQSMNQTTSSMASSVGNGKVPRQMTYIIKSDMGSKGEFAKWFTEFVTEPKMEQEALWEEQGKVNKFDHHALNFMLGLINCVRNNSIMPVVYAENDMGEDIMLNNEEDSRKEEMVRREMESEMEKKTEEGELIEKIEKMQFQPALNVHCEFFQAEHEAVRSLSKVCMVSKDSEKVRKTICLQTLWFLLNDSQKKISVICSELNKAYYEEFFGRQRKLYNNLNNVRFYSRLDSCAVAEGQHTLRKDGEIWFFDDSVDGIFSEIVERVKELNSFWIFTTEEEKVKEFKKELDDMSVKHAMLDTDLEAKMKEMDMGVDSELCSMPWLSGKSMKLPMRLQCDLLVVGDLIGLTQLKNLYRYLKSADVVNYNESLEKKEHNRDNKEHKGGNNHRGGNNYHEQPKMHRLNFNPSKKFRSVKFIRGGSIDNLRSSLKMHDSIQANVVLMHIGDEDLFKSRNDSQTTVDRVKELTTLVKEYCPKAFTVISHLMKRVSRTDNMHAMEVNKGIAKFCKEVKEAKEMMNLVHMDNKHLEPENHTQEGGKVLNTKGLRMYIDNFLYSVDYYLIKSHKQH